MKWLLAAFGVCVLLRGAFTANSAFQWCYHDSTCAPAVWPVNVSQFCNGSRQSPININTSATTVNSSLTDFIFTNYNSTSALQKIENTGRTVKVTLAQGVQVSGGGLSEPYDSLQFHLHWGNGTSVPGSEHTVDGKRFPMELHIVNSKSSLNRNTTAAVADPEGLAALGFFIEADTSGSNVSSRWSTLAAYLSNITESGQSVSITDAVSLDDLLTGVNRSNYYRYLGSLTTPSCNEAVVWTVFIDSIKVPQYVIDLFGTTVRIGNSSSIHMVNVYRPLQPDLPVTVSASSSSGSTTTNTTGGTSSAPKAYCSLGLMALALLLGKVWS